MTTPTCTKCKAPLATPVKLVTADEHTCLSCVKAREKGGE